MCLCALQIISELKTIETLQAQEKLLPPLNYLETFKLGAFPLIAMTSSPLKSQGAFSHPELSVTYMLIYLIFPFCL